MNKEGAIMKYDFDQVIDRRKTSACKWDIGPNELPMWIADMDFKTAPEIIEAITKRVEQGIFGYTNVPDGWYDAYLNWWKTYHQFTMQKEWLIFSTGVVPAISSIVRKLTTPAEKVLIQTPVYNIFFNSILNNGRLVVENELLYDGKNYQIDFPTLEKQLADPQVQLMILCNPHNPIGKIWAKEDLERIGMLCEKYHVTIISDEIHCDITDPAKEYTPFASINSICQNNSITCLSPSKAFNLAGLQSAAVVVANPVLRHKVWRALNTDEVAEPNAFAIEATMAAFNKGRNWLEALKKYLYDNKQKVQAFIKNELPMIKLVSSDATYLLWLDCQRLNVSSTTLASFIREKTGLYLSSGLVYGQNGDSFLRMNIACPKVLLEDGLERLKKGIDLFLEKS